MDFADLPDLASARLGGRALFTNDDFFASCRNLVKAEPAVFIPGKYTTRGKWMDGWESRRRRTPGHDWCVVRLGLRGRIHGLDVDTSHFVGNQPERASLEAVDLPGTPTRRRLEQAAWVSVLEPSPTGPGTHNRFVVAAAGPFTHIRLNIFPDGGVARLRVHGEVAVDRSRWGRRVVDLAALVNGGVVLAASDEHFGRKEHLLLPGRSRSMADGWETRRRRGPGHDWAIVRLGAPGTIERIEIDTAHFKGNFPESAWIEACHRPGADAAALDGVEWTEVLLPARLKAHARHLVGKGLKAKGPFTHVRLNIHPDGGVARLRIHGRVVAP